VEVSRVDSETAVSYPLTSVRNNLPQQQRRMHQILPAAVGTPGGSCLRVLEADPELRRMIGFQTEVANRATDGMEIGHRY